MNNPLSNFQIGQMRHRELEAEVSRWVRGSEGDGLRSKRAARTVMTLLGIVAIVVSMFALGLIL